MKYRAIKQKYSPAISGAVQKGDIDMRKKKYYTVKVENINQLVETPASRAQTDKERFVINTIISIVSAVAAVIAAVVSIIALVG